MIERSDWVKVIRSLLKQMPFSPTVLYVPNRDPYENVFLLSQIDIERTHTNDPEKIVDLLCCETEGWFFEDRASFIALKREVDEDGLGKNIGE